MAPYEALNWRLRQSPIFWMDMGERPSTGPDLVKHTSKKVDLIWKRFLTAQSRRKSYVDRRRGL